MIPTEESFLKDVAEHRLTVARDNGVYRHLSFRKPGTYCMGFDLITWPGYLCYCGDMGTYVFLRLEDMFEFFRADAPRRRDGKALYINLSYWSEKLTAVDGNRREGSAKEFSADLFVAAVKRQLLEWLREHRYTTTKTERRDLWEAVQNEVIERSDEGEHLACHAAHDFSHRIGKHNFYFADFFEHNLHEYTFRFIWCCYALAWGIRQYDAAKQAAA